MHYGLLVIILYIVLVFKLVHEPFYVPKKPLFWAKNDIFRRLWQKRRRLIMLKINFFVCHMTFNWPSRAFILVHQPFYVPKQPFLGQKWCFKAMMTRVKKVNFSLNSFLCVLGPSDIHFTFFHFYIWSRAVLCQKNSLFGPKITF